MINDSIKRRLGVLKDSIKEAQEEVDQIEMMLLLFPDLAVDTSRWGNRKFTSRMVNSLAVDYDAGHSCGCCDDSPLYAYPFVEFEGIRVYSNPAKVYIGERCYYVEGGELYDPDCLDELKKNGFSKDLIKKIETLVTRPPSYLENGDDDSDEAEGDT